jgi:hypothetical protein
MAGTSAVSLYNLSRSLEFIKVQDFNCGQMRVSGCKTHYKFVLRAVAKAKSVTNNLPILSVLATGIYSVLMNLPILSILYFLIFTDIESVPGISSEPSSVNFLVNVLSTNSICMSG